VKNPAEIKALASERLEEAKILCESGRYDGAFYLAGYSIELTLKAKICERFGIDNLFDGVKSEKSMSEVKQKLKTHDISQLLIFCGLSKKLQTAIANRNTVLMETYGYLIAGTQRNSTAMVDTEWSEQVRYLPVGSQQEQYVKRFVALLQDNQNGLLQWIENN